LPEALGIVLTRETEENTKMNDCYFEKKDWRSCRDEVRDAASEFSDFNPYHVYEAKSCAMS
jgi:hypothetical protein